MSSLLKQAREWATPTLKTSAFLERGVLTPEEFVAAGDELCYRCPTWSWESGENSKLRSHLPPDKQFLITRNVPCAMRCAAVEETNYDHEEEGGDEGEWFISKIQKKKLGGYDDDDDGFDLIDNEHESSSSSDEDDDGVPEESVVCLPSVSEAGYVSAAAKSAVKKEAKNANSSTVSLGGISIPQEILVDENHDIEKSLLQTDITVADGLDDDKSIKDHDDDDDEYADMQDFEENDMMVDDEAVVHTTTVTQRPSGDTAPAMMMEEDNHLLQKVRTYDISISYDKYYQTPRVWLFGYDEEGNVLTSEQMFEDVMSDYVKRTVTIENHPHLLGPHASIHPCQHGAVMKNIVQNLTSRSNGGEEGGRVVPPPTVTVESYLFIFLKFVSSIIPTVNYDFTMEVTTSNT